MSPTTQISAYISEETKAEMEAYAKQHGVKKGFLIEEALQHHLQALREIPEDLVIPAQLTLTAQAMEDVAGRLAADEPPTDALRALFRGR